MSEEKKEWIRANKTEFLEKYFSYFSDAARAKLLSKIETRQKLKKAGLD
jgi:hypothetical protein